MAGVRARGQLQEAVEGVVAAAVGAAGGDDGSGDLADLVGHGPGVQSAGFEARVLEERGGAGGGDGGRGGGRCRCGGCYYGAHWHDGHCSRFQNQHSLLRDRSSGKRGQSEGALEYSFPPEPVWHLAE